MGLGILGSEYPPAYLNIHTPFKRGLYTGSSVGLSASNLRMASLIEARSEEVMVPIEVMDGGRKSMMEETTDSAADDGLF